MVGRKSRRVHHIHLLLNSERLSGISNLRFGGICQLTDCQFSVGLFSRCSMTRVPIGAFLESSFRPTFSMAAKTALPGGSGAIPVGAPVACADAPAGPLKGFLAMPDAAAT